MLAVGGQEIVLILIGGAWLPSAKMLQILALAVPFAILFPLHSEANKAIGEGLVFMRIEFAKKIFLVIAIAIGFTFGIKGVLAALVIAAIVDYILSAAPSVRYLGYDWQTQLRDVAPAALCGLLGAGLVVALEAPLIGAGAFTSLIVKTAIVVVVFCFAIVTAGDRIAPEVAAGLRRAAAFSRRSNV
jgi:hypothetical protein